MAIKPPNIPKCSDDFSLESCILEQFKMKCFHPCDSDAFTANNKLMSLH